MLFPLGFVGLAGDPGRGVGLWLVLRRATPAFRGFLESINGSVELVSLCN